MEYGIRELSETAGVSARTLRYYDEIGLLKPLYANEAGYRFYGETEVKLLQQILFYRERGFALKEIKRLLQEEDFDILNALNDHLADLTEQRKRIEALIRTVEQTIRSMKGEYEMNDTERFEAFKERVVSENEKKYGSQIREQYGNEEMDAANKKVLNMTEEDWERFQNLGNEIKEQLKEAVLAKERPEGEKGKRIVLLHKEWLCMTWKAYKKEAHKGIASTYISDERFRLYYDQEVSGCAAFLEQAVRAWVDKI